MRSRAAFVLAAFVVGLGVSAAGAEPAAKFEPEATVRRADRLAMVALAHAGSRIVAAGERGRILLSDDGGHTWKVAATPTHHTLTSLYFVDGKVGFATGHQATLLRTEDGGLTWQQMRIDMKAKGAAQQIGDQRPALFAVRLKGGKGLAVGAYGAYLESVDGGGSWQAREIGPPDFDRHLTGIAWAGEGRTLLVGEAGMMLATNDGGATWEVLKSPYEGSFFGAIGLRGGAVIAFGMRGNAFRSADAGRSWTRIDLGAYKGALQGASELADGSVVLTGADGMIASSRDGGITFAVNPIASRVTVTAFVRTLGRSLTAGPAGLRWAN